MWNYTEYDILIVVELTGYLKYLVQDPYEGRGRSAQERVEQMSSRPLWYGVGNAYHSHDTIIKLSD